MSVQLFNVNSYFKIYKKFCYNDDMDQMKELYCFTNVDYYNCDTIEKRPILQFKKNYFYLKRGDGYYLINACDPRHIYEKDLLKR
jgi:hypothetical protein